MELKDEMKRRIGSLLLLLMFISILGTACSNQGDTQLLLPNYATSKGWKVEDAYGKAAQYPQVLASVPCYCGCGTIGHKSNLDCFIGELGPNQEVISWDSHGST